jgi:hypothetical protein
MDNKTQLDRLTELTILHRSQLRELSSQLPGLREEILAEFERRMDEAEPHFREELEAFAQARTEHEVAELSAKLKSEIDSVSEAAQKRVTDKIGLIVAEKKAVRELMKKAQAEIKGALKTVPGQIKTVVGLEAESIREETKKQLDTHFAVPRTINPRGVWKKNTVYEPLDLVSDNGSSYIANVRNRDVKPGMGKDEWTLIARRGGGGGSPITSLSELVGPPTDGQILIGDNGNYVNANLSAGYGINITEGAGSIEISTSGFVVFKGAWNAATNTPALASGVGTAGNYYVVATAGSTNLDGITDWQAGDWAIFNGTAWEKVDNSEIITSVNGQTGVVVITKSDVGLGNVTNDAQLKIASDLSDLSDAPTARSNLGLGDSATLDVGTTSGTVAAGDDSRLSDARTPTAHAESHVDGTDDIRDATASLKGLATAAQIAKLDGIDAGANVGITELTGDVTAGPGGDSQAATLASTGVAAASYGSATQVGTFTVDAKGRLTAASDVTITPAFASITSKPTTLSGYGITDGVNTSQLGAANGVATLDSGSKLTSSQLPDIAITEYLGDSANEAAMLALTGEQGDWTTRTDLGTVWIITGSDPSVIGGWTQLSYPTAPVTSVATKTGAVTLDSSDVGLGNVDNTSDANKPVSTAQQTALDLKANLISPTLVTPALGTPSSGVVTNLTGTASININGTVGATTPSTGAFTTLSAITNVNAGGNNLSLTNTNAGSSAQATIRFINDTAEQGNISLNSSTYSFGTLVANAIGIRSYTAAGVYLTAENASGHIRLGIGATPSTIADFSSTGLAVTGALSATTTLQAKTGTTNPASSGALTGLSMGFDSNAEVSWIQSERNSLAETRSLQLNPNGGNVGIGEVSPQGALQITRTTDHANFVLRSDLGAGGGYGGFIRGRSEAFQGGQLDLGTLEANVGTVRMSINHLGNVGVGTTGPSTKLHVQTATNGGIVVNDGTVNGIIYGSTTLTNSFAIGTTSNHPLIFGTNNSFPQMMLATSGNVGIGTTSPSASLDVVGGAGAGVPAMIVRVDNAAGINFVVQRDDADTGTLDIGTSSYHNLALIANNSEKLRIDAVSGNVGIGTTGPSYQLQLSTDSAAKPSTNTWTIASDARIKTETGEYTKGLDAVLSLRPVTYRYNGKAGMVDDGEDKISIIAQEAINAFPECVGSYMTKLNEDDEEETEVLNWNGHALTFALVNSIKELVARIEALENN